MKRIPHVITKHNPGKFSFKSNLLFALDPKDIPEGRRNGCGCCGFMADFDARYDSTYGIPKRIVSVDIFINLAEISRRFEDCALMVCRTITHEYLHAVMSMERHNEQARVERKLSRGEENIVRRLENPYSSDFEKLYGWGD